MKVKIFIAIHNFLYLHRFLTCAYSSLLLCYVVVIDGLFVVR